ncbi:stage VI sporulation protein F [Bacillus sp. V5-8f]|uniref:stage VI sporulation protein F n=1 Tax=Bacillus sp. V5-8f TaxID=2053044 RepID=UPI000C769FF4|nr:stage VI sporulation protein F [Bacillus sp. V5-8f]PLT33062.1 sporulation protein [Bacillus sp. V5-8f]
MDNNFFKNVGDKTGVNMGDVFKLANSLQGANFKDETTVRKMVRDVAKLANKPISKQKQDEIVNFILKDGQNLNFGTLAKMLNNNKKK